MVARIHCSIVIEIKREIAARLPYGHRQHVDIAGGQPTVSVEVTRQKQVGLQGLEHIVRDDAIKGRGGMDAVPAEVVVWIGTTSSVRVFSACPSNFVMPYFAGSWKNSSVIWGMSTTISEASGC